MNDIQSEIDKLAAALRKQQEAGQPIDPNRIQQLTDMRRDRDQALALWRRKRFQELQFHTREWTSKLMGLNLKSKPDIAERLYQEQDRYDIASVLWFRDEVCHWEDSEAAQVAASILIIVGEI